MASTPYDTFFPEVLPYVPEVSDLLAINAIRNACIYFCERTRYLQNSWTTTVTQGVSDYTPVPSSGCKVVSVLTAYKDGKFLVPRSKEELDNLFRFTNWRVYPGEPQYYLSFVQDVLTLAPQPQLGGGTLSVYFCEAPLRASTTVNSIIYERYAEVIALGARSRLHATPGQKYSNDELAARYKILFEAEVNKVRLDVNKSLSRAMNRVEFQRWA